MALASLMTKGKVLDNTDAQKRKDAEKKMAAPLRKISDTWRTKLSATNNVELQNWYDMAQDLIKVENERSIYGDQASEQLAACHGLTSSNVQFLRRVGRYFSPKEFARIIEHNEEQMKLNSGFHGIGRKHLELLTKISDQSYREHLVKQIASEGLTVDSVQRIVQDYVKQHGQSANVNLHGKRASPLITSTSKQIDKLLESVGRMQSDDFMNQLTAMQPTTAVKSCEVLREVKHKLQHLLSALSNIDDPIEAALEHLAVHETAKGEEEVTDEPPEVEASNNESQDSSEAEELTPGEKASQTKQRNVKRKVNPAVLAAKAKMSRKKKLVEKAAGKA